MTISQIKAYWIEHGAMLHTYKPSQLKNPLLLKSTIDFLVDCGLPDSCAPFMSFDDCKKTTLPFANQAFNLDFDELNQYLYIGSNGGGDPVCIDIHQENEIVYINHDNDFDRVFMNTSIQQFIECSIRFRDFLILINSRSEKGGFSRGKFSDEEFSNLSDDLKAIDEKCMTEIGCWTDELAYLLWERDND